MWLQKPRHVRRCVEKPPMSSASSPSAQTAPIPRAALTVNETCAALSISRTKFYEQVEEGRIRVLKLGRRTLVPVTEVPAFLDSLRPKAA